MRWLKFNLVGLVGVVVQISVLSLLVYGLNLPHLAATVAAVEAAILHNFIWHVRFTWADRGHETADMLMARLSRFQVSNGAVSVVGNLLVMHWLADEAHVPLLLANGLAILFCSTANFLMGERFVFRPQS